METATILLESYGYWLLLAVGFAEFAGAPIASVPVLVLAGAGAAQGVISVPAAALVAAAGGLMADTGWYALSRWKGDRLVDTVCNLTSNPRSCVFTVVDRVRRMGPALVLPSKFLPGTGNLAAASAGLAGMRPAVFVAADAAALSLWAFAYVGLGYLFSGQVASVIDWVSGFMGLAAAISAGLILGAGVWRYVRAVMHREPHHRATAAAVAGTFTRLDADAA
jgi:membrane protein DedA with SNARE-associated domain